MRRLMWLAMGFALSCGLWLWVLPAAAVIPLAVAVLAGSAMCLIRKDFRIGTFCAWGMVLGLLWCSCFDRMYLASARTADGSQIPLLVTATDYSFETDYGSAVDGNAMLEGKSYRIRVYMNEKEDIAPGDTLTGVFRVRFTPGGEKSPTYHAGNGIFLLGYQRGDLVWYKAAVPGLYVAELAKMMKDNLRALFPEDVFPFAQALLLGDATELDYETETAFRITGIRHIIAVSGLHVMLLYNLILAVTFRNRYLTALLAFPTLMLFAAVAGFTPSVTRSCLMVALMISAQLVNREYDPPTALAFAVVVMLIGNPMVISSVGFQLSVGSVVGIHLFQNPLNTWAAKGLGEGKLRKGIASSVSYTLSASSLTTILCAYYFGTVSLVGLVANLLILWLVNYVFMGLVAVSGLYFLSVKAASWLTWLLSWAIRLLLWVSKKLAAFPLAAVYTKSPYIVAWLVFLVVLLGTFLLNRKRRPLVFACCAALGLCGALLASWMEPLSDDLRVTMLDVGQGQSILLQNQGRTILVDCGGEDDSDVADLVAETLLSQGISRLDAVVITHCDADHAGGLSNLLTRVEADVIFYPATEELVLPGANLYPVSDSLDVSLEGGNLRIFGPIYTSDANENSLCVLFTWEDCDILITGDRGELGEFSLLTEYELPDVELLIAGHHGSKYSTSEALLQAVRPEIIFVSAGADNSYGHPAQEMLDRAAAIGASVYRTDLHGTLVYRR